MFEKAASHECWKKIAEHGALFVKGFAKDSKFPVDYFHSPNIYGAIPSYTDW